jgi:hypothetical protein
MTGNNVATISRKIVFNTKPDLQAVKHMEKDENKDEDRRSEIGELNKIVEELLMDARELVGDLLSGIHTTLIMGTVSIILGIQTTWYNRHYITAGDYIPLILAGIIIGSGVIIVFRGLALKSKYSKLYEFQRDTSR